MDKKIIAVLLTVVMLASSGFGRTFAAEGDDQENRQTQILQEEQEAAEDGQPLEKARSEEMENLPETEDEGQAADALHNPLPEAEKPLGRVVRQAAVEVDVDSVDELVQTAQEGGSDKKITLTTAFYESVAGGVAVNLIINHNDDVIIEGEDSTPLLAAAGKPHFSITNNGAGTVTLKNMQLKGSGANTGGIALSKGEYLVKGLYLENLQGVGIRANNCSVSVKDTIFDGSKSYAIGGANNAQVDIEGTIFRNGTTTAVDEIFKLVVDNSVFENNTSSYGAAIRIAANSTSKISNSSFVGNLGTWPGYSGGAITSDQKNFQELNISNCYFFKNEARQGGNNGGRGGAIAMHQGSGTVNISQCYFEGNAATASTSQSDGGAVSWYSGNDSSIATLNIDNSTFAENTSGDDAGAVFIEGRSNKVYANISNSTFYKNIGKAFDQQGAGGAIQISYAAGATLTNNTFYGNEHKSDSKKGHDVGSSPQVFSYPKAIFQNNLFVGSGSTIGENVLLAKLLGETVTDKGGNIGLDNKKKQPTGLTAISVFGTTDPQLAANGGVYAGCALDVYEPLVVPSLMIAPALDGTAGIYADGTGVAGGPAADQRGVTRGAKTDAGSLDIVWVKFDVTANGGSWNGLTPGYHGSTYIAGTDGEKGYFHVTDNGGSVSLPTDEPEKTGEVFVGWFDQATGGTQLTDRFLAVEQTVYAQWAVKAASKYKITYLPNGPDVAQMPEAQEDVEEGTEISISAQVPTRAGYTFTGWQLSVDESIKQAGETFVMPGADVTLTAQWKENVISRYKITYLPNGQDVAQMPEAQEDVEEGIEISISAQVPTRTGYTFTGWQLSVDESIKQAGETFIMPGADVTLTAQWKENGVSKYKVTYLPNGQDVAQMPETQEDVEEGTEISISAQVPTRTGYTFTGWQLSVDESTKQAGETFVMPGADVTLTAQWKANGGGSSGGGSGSKKIPEEKTPLGLIKNDHIVYVQGYPEGDFRSNHSITRAEAAQLFYNLLLDVKKTGYSNSFADVNSGAWYAEAVNCLSENQVILGYPDGTFKPNDYITRAEFATLSSKFDHLSSAEANQFADVTSSHWAISYINSAAVKGWIKGYENGEFRPEKEISRAEVVTLVNAILERKVSLGDISAEAKTFSDLSSTHWAYCDIMEAANEHTYSRKEDGLHEIWHEVAKGKKVAE